jgi:hypothetical protein
MLLVERACSGSRDVIERSGTHLALALIQANDAFCWMNAAEESEELKAMLPLKGERNIVVEDAMGCWFEDADMALYGFKTLEMLERFKRQFPVSEKFCLATVNTPMTEWETMLILKSTPPLEVVDCVLGGPVPKTPSEFPVAERQLDLGGGRELGFARDIDGWKVRLTVKAKECHPRMVRLGLHKATQDPADPDCWIADLGWHTEGTKREALAAPVHIVLFEGVRVVVSNQPVPKAELAGNAL